MGAHSISEGFVQDDQGVMVLMKGVQIGTLYKLLASVDSTGCS
jgi:hypothetical protein